MSFFLLYNFLYFSNFYKVQVFFTFYTFIKITRIKDKVKKLEKCVEQKMINIVIYLAFSMFMTLSITYILCLKSLLQLFTYLEHFTRLDSQ